MEMNTGNNKGAMLQLPVYDLPDVTEEGILGETPMGIDPDQRRQSEGQIASPPISRGYKS